MIESGTIIKAGAKKATVRIMKREQCKGCNACGMFGDHLDLVIDNTLNTVKGDSVEIDIKNSSDRMFAFIAYIIPLIFTAVGLAVGIIVGIHELYIVLIAAGMLALGFAAAFFVDKKWSARRKLNPVMLKVVKKDQQAQPEKVTAGD